MCRDMRHMWHKRHLTFFAFTFHLRFLGYFLIQLGLKTAVDCIICFLLHTNIIRTCDMCSVLSAHLISLLFGMMHTFEKSMGSDFRMCSGSSSSGSGSSSSWKKFAGVKRWFNPYSYQTGVTFVTNLWLTCIFTPANFSLKAQWEVGSPGWPLVRVWFEPLWRATSFW